MEDLYLQLRQELMVLWEYLRTLPPEVRVQEKQQIQEELSRIIDLAKKIGGALNSDAERLEKEIQKFIHSDKHFAEIDQMLKDALKLEQDTREL